MVTLKGTYINGSIVLERAVKSSKPLKVIVTFMDEDIKEMTEPLNFSHFSFQSARENSKHYAGSISDAVIEERRKDV